MEDQFRIWFPLQKSGRDRVRDKDVYVIEGIASTEDPDLQNEIVYQDGIDYRPLLESGYINWDHMPGPENIIGEPSEVRIQKGPSLWIKGFLYPHVERAKAVVNLLESQNSVKESKRRLGWSIEGRVVEREGNRIKKSVLQHIAITHQPVNPNTWAELVKSMTSASGAPLRLQNLDTGIMTALFEDCDNHCYDGKRFKHGVKGAFNHLVKCKGISEEDAYNFLMKLYRIFR